MTRLFASSLLIGFAEILVACSGTDSSSGPENSGGMTVGSGGTASTSGGVTSVGGVPATGGATSSTSPGVGGKSGIGGSVTGGATPTGGSNSATGGATPTGGFNSGTGGATAMGGSATGGKSSTGGARTGGTFSTGGINPGTGGAFATGGKASTGGARTGGASSTTGGSAAGGAATGGAAGGGNSGTGGGGTTGGATSSGCGSPAGLVSGQASIDVNGVTRDYILRVPDNYNPNQPYRLIFGWHQLAGSAQSIANMGYYGLQTPSANQAILVAPQGLFQITPSSGHLDAGWWNNNGEDVNFYHAMLDLFSSKLCIDKNRIFSVGFSYGAMFSFTLACTPGTMMRAIAPQAGSAFGCSGTHPVAVMGFVGTQDSLMNSHLQAVGTFAQRNGCSTQTVAVSPSWCDGLASNYQPCSCVQYTNCNAGYPVVSCTYNNTHMFAPNSGQVIWNFFSQF